MKKYSIFSLIYLALLSKIQCSQQQRQEEKEMSVLSAYANQLHESLLPAYERFYTNTRYLYSQQNRRRSQEEIREAYETRLRELLEWTVKLNYATRTLPVEAKMALFKGIFDAHLSRYTEELAAARIRDQRIQYLEYLGLNAASKK